MDTSHENEATPLIFTPVIATAVGDNRQLHEKQLAVNIILASTFFERIAFYTLAANIALSLEMNQLNWTAGNGLIASFLFSGTSYISSIIFAIISDAKAGRAKTIIIGFVLYLIGYTMAILVVTERIGTDTSGTCNNGSSLITRTIFEEACAKYILPTLVVIAIGAGAVQSNMAVFGAEQIQESKITSRFFDKYVVAVNMGGIFAMSATPFTLGNDVAYRIVYIVTASLLFVSALLFIVGWRYYIHVTPYDSVITNCVPVIINALQTWRRYKQNMNSRDAEYRNAVQSNLVNASRSSSREEPMIIDERPSVFLDFAKIVNHGKFQDGIVEDVKSLRKAFMVFTLLIPYWLVYNQINSTFRVQTQSMLNSGDQQAFTIVSLTDPVTIIIGILLLNMFVYKCMDARNRPSAITTKFIIGMCFAFICMCIAGTVQTYSPNECVNKHGNQYNNLTMYELIPQSVFMGFSEIFVMLASFEYAYFAAPRSAQTLFMSLRFCSVGIGSFIGAAYIAAFPTTSTRSTYSLWTGQEKCSNLYIYFFSLAGFQLIFIIIFIVCQKKFGIIKLNSQQMETDQCLQHSSTPLTD